MFLWASLALNVAGVAYIYVAQGDRVNRWNDSREDAGVFLLSFVLLSLARQLSSKSLLPWLADCVLSAKYTGSTRSAKKNKFSSCFFKGCYFMLMVAVEWYFLRDQEWFPPQLGGYGATKNLWAEDKSVSRNLRRVFMVNLGYHAMSTFFHILVIDRRSDFEEYVFHHVLTLWLMILAYLEDFLKPGFLVLFVNDVPDLPLYFAKSLVDTPFKITCLVFFAALIVMYGYLRLYCFPCVIIRSLFVETEVHWIYKGMLISLFALHVFWFVLIGRVAYLYLSTGSRVDLQSDKAADVALLNKKKKKNH